MTLKVLDFWQPVKVIEKSCQKNSYLGLIIEKICIPNQHMSSKLHDWGHANINSRVVVMYCIATREEPVKTQNHALQNKLISSDGAISGI